LGFFVRDRPKFRLQCGRVFGNDLRIDPVGFGKHADGLSVPSDAGGVDDNGGKTGLVAGLNQGMFITPGCFHHDTFDGVAFEDFNEPLLDLRFAVGDRIKLSSGMKVGTKPAGKATPHSTFA
jgi:hypothetical protein